MSKRIHKAAEDLLAQIDLYTDCMDGHIVRENLDQYMDALEQALDDGIGKMPFHVQELRPEVLAFALLMEERLREKDADKGRRWKESDIDNLQVCAATKVYQLDRAIQDGTGTSKHAIDLGNYAMMIADVAGALNEAVEIINGEPQH